MRSAFTLACAVIGGGAALAADAPKYPDLAYVRNIYVAPMANGLDQYLANRLTQGGRFQIVTDPQTADAVLTDRVGESFEAYLTELYPPPKPEKEEKSNEDEDSPVMFADDARPRTSSFGRARGNLYLVDRGTRKVIWSDYRRPRNTHPDTLDDLANHFAGRLRKQAGKAMSPPQPPAPPQLVSPEPKPDTAAPAPQ